MFRKLLANISKLFKEYGKKYVRFRPLRSWLTFRICEELLSTDGIDGLNIGEVLDRITAELLASTIVKLTKIAYWDTYRVMSRVKTLIR